jgi:hypothetical protein
MSPLWYPIFNILFIIVIKIYVYIKGVKHYLYRRPISLVDPNERSDPTDGSLATSSNYGKQI